MCANLDFKNDFISQKERTVETTYTTNPRSMMQVSSLTLNINRASCLIFKFALFLEFYCFARGFICDVCVVQFICTLVCNHSYRSFSIIILHFEHYSLLLIH